MDPLRGRFASSSVAVLATALAAGCGVSSHPLGAGSGGDSSGNGVGVSVTSGVGPSSSSGSLASSGTTPNVCPYPVGPYGTSAGAVVDGSLQWMGYTSNATVPTLVKLADYYDCDGSRGNSALLIEESSLACGACLLEASHLAATMTADGWATKGIRVLILLYHDGTDQPATVQNAAALKQQYGLQVDVVADPAFTFLGGGLSGEGLPLHLVVDPRTMKIVTRYEGVDPHLEYPDLEALAAKNGP